MKVVISGRAAAFHKATNEEIAQPEELKRLDGVAYTDDSCCKYLPPELDDIGLMGGLVRLVYTPETRQLRVVTDYQAPHELTSKELKALVQETTAQWSDGIGEDAYWQEVRPGISVNLSPDVDDLDLRTEQIDDGSKPPVKKLSPLIKAVEAGDLDKIKKSLAKGEDIDARDKRGRTLLHIAIWSRHLDTALLLITYDADVNAPEISGEDLSAQTPLHVACRVTATSLPLVQALLGKGAYRNGIDSWGRTPLMWAATSGHPEIAKLLLERGAAVNVRDTHKNNEGHSALMLTYHPEVLKLLLQHGADPNIRNDRGLTSYETALFQAGGPQSGAKERWLPAAELLLAAIRQRAEKGDAISQHTLADFHERGVGAVPKNPQESFRDFERSANNGCRLALARLGLCHLSGNGTAIDLGKAMECLKKAAEAGVPLAMGVLGECCAKGVGAAQDLGEAVKWYRRGAEIDPASHDHPAEIYDFRNGGGACRAQLGECYEQGQGVAKDLKQALHWYKAALQVGFHHVNPAIKRLEE
jgi:ankyrin repeat protein